MTDWPNFIRSKLKELKVSQRALSSASGVSRSTIRRFLNGESRIELATLEELLQALGYSTAPLSNGGPSPRLLRENVRLPKREPILSKLIKAAGMGVRY